MASKHDAKRAQENFWVMQQNMAKQKGGRGYKPKALAPKFAKPLVVVPAGTTTSEPQQAVSADASSPTKAP